MEAEEVIQVYIVIGKKQYIDWIENALEINMERITER